MQEFCIGNNEAGQRLDKFLHKYLKEAGTSFLYKMLRKKNITLNKKKAEGKEILQVNDRIQFFFSDETFEKFRGGVKTSGITGEVYDKTKRTNTSDLKEFKNVESVRTDESPRVVDRNKSYWNAYHTLKKIEVIFENEHILLVNKPAGVLSQKASPQDLSLNEWLIGYLLETKQITEMQLETFKPSVCNRLDRNTSGLVICGKSLYGSQTMSELIKTRKIRKFYRTFVKGKVEEKAYVKGYLKKDESCNKVIFKENLREMERKEFTEIETFYQPLKYKDGYTYLEVELLTGKTHQIRAHLAGMGHCLMGDEKYGDRKWNSSFKSKGIPKWQLLHSYRVEFPQMQGGLEGLSCQVFVAKEPEFYQKLK